MVLDRMLDFTAPEDAAQAKRFGLRNAVVLASVATAVHFKRLLADAVSTA